MAALLAALSFVPLAQAIPATHADVYFRRTIDDPFTDPGYFETQDAASYVNLDRSRPEGSTARFEGDAAAGSLRAHAHAVPIRGPQGQEAWARGFVNDRFTLQGPADGTPVHITVAYTIDGWLAGPGSGPETLAAFANAAVATQFVAGAGNLRHEQWARTEAQMGICWQIGCTGFNIPIHWADEIELDVTAGLPFDIYYALSAFGGWAFGGSMGTSDFGSTGVLSFLLPPGTRVTSEGGFSQGANGVAEPSVALLLIAGMLGLARTRRPRPAARAGWAGTGP